ncbi:Hypothetical protein PBC10988_12630 [Planctomycetales bacterium 10988]|nr:Hypothetical protein PBC10988_12630 [Planctomycetales bacterium 10988]
MGRVFISFLILLVVFIGVGTYRSWLGFEIGRVIETERYEVRFSFNADRFRWDCNELYDNVMSYFGTEEATPDSAPSEKFPEGRQDSPVPNAPPVETPPSEEESLEETVQEASLVPPTNN